MTLIIHKFWKRKSFYTSLFLFACGVLAFFSGHAAGEHFTVATLLVPALTTGAGIATIVTGQNQCDNIIVIGTVDTANPLQGLVVELGGTPFINILNSAALVGAFAKWMSGGILAGASTVVGLTIRVATGLVKATTKLTFVNNGATTPSVYSYSDNETDAVPVNAATNSINPNSFQDYNKFSALMIAVPANISSADVVFRNKDKNGNFNGKLTKATMTAIELAADYVNYQPNAEAGGLLNACLVIDNRKQRFESVRIYTAGTAVTVLTVALPQQAFKQLNR